MSNATTKPRKWHFYIRHMIGFCEKIVSYTSGYNQEEFIAAPLVYDATLRNLELIGEPAAHITRQVHEIHPEIPWRDSIGTRNQIAHSHLHISNNVIWFILQTDIPNLLPELHNILNTTKEESV